MSWYYRAFLSLDVSYFFPIEVEDLKKVGSFLLVDIYEFFKILLLESHWLNFSLTFSSSDSYLTLYVDLVWFESGVTKSGICLGLFSSSDLRFILLNYGVWTTDGGTLGISTPTSTKEGVFPVCIDWHFENTLSV